MLEGRSPLVPCSGSESAGIDDIPFSLIRLRQGRSPPRAPALSTKHVHGFCLCGLLQVIPLPSSSCLVFLISIILPWTLSQIMSTSKQTHVLKRIARTASDHRVQYSILPSGRTTSSKVVLLAIRNTGAALASLACSDILSRARVALSPDVQLNPLYVQRNDRVGATSTCTAKKSAIVTMQETVSHDCLVALQ